MACSSGMDTDAALGAALARATMWRVLGRLLELQDTQGTVLARFEARPAR